ncbi:hypothetical protein F383_08389 [Gossypium arboreum]|uniref:Uncharacterized protein n=1 Tax=Gossypium arboreum TaxID=29729 RepID=A0A0B0NRD9_GOSAR|nr:hypothetical protein F383_08389 [Gossypium arboreum]
MANLHPKCHIYSRSYLNSISHILLTLELSMGFLTQAIGQDVATRAAHTYCQVSTTHAGLPSHQ